METNDTNAVTPFLEDGLVPEPGEEEETYVFSLSQLGIPIVSTAIIIFGI